MLHLVPVGESGGGKATIRRGGRLQRGKKKNMNEVTSIRKSGSDQQDIIGQTCPTLGTERTGGSRYATICLSFEEQEEGGQEKEREDSDYF